MVDKFKLKLIQLNFCKELEEASAGKKTSLPFILHTLPSAPIVKTDETFQVMVIGGSIFKQALAIRRGNDVAFSDKRQENLPILHTIDDVFTLVERHLNPEIKVVSLNFAYPLLPVLENAIIDGVLATGTKEHAFLGLIGKRVGQTLEEYFLKKKCKKITFAAANDTVCLLLSGLGEASRDRLACGIVGTGINFAFFTSPTELVNLESGNFDKFNISNETRIIDRASSQPGKGLFEKETAGCYLYQHFNLIILAQKLDYPPLTSTLELKKLALLDNSAVSKIARELIRKSAGLIAAQIAGIMLFKKRDMTFVMEGSMFWEGEIYKGYVENFVRELIPEHKVNFKSVNESHFLGAAKLVC